MGEGVEISEDKGVREVLGKRCEARWRVSVSDEKGVDIEKEKKGAFMEADPWYRNSLKQDRRVWGWGGGPLEKKSPNWSEWELPHRFGFQQGLGPGRVRIQSARRKEYSQNFNAPGAGKISLLEKNKIVPIGRKKRVWHEKKKKGPLNFIDARCFIIEGIWLWTVVSKLVFDDFWQAFQDFMFWISLKDVEKIQLVRVRLRRDGNSRGRGGWVVVIKLGGDG